MNLKSFILGICINFPNHRKLGGLKQKQFLFHNSEDQKSKMKVLGGLGPSGSSERESYDPLLASGDCLKYLMSFGL